MPRRNQIRGLAKVLTWRPSFTKLPASQLEKTILEIGRPLDITIEMEPARQIGQGVASRGVDECEGSHPFQGVTRRIQKKVLRHRFSNLEDEAGQQLLDQLAWRAQRANPSLVHDCHPITEPFSLFHVMRRENQGSALRAQGSKPIPKMLPGVRVEASGGFVENDEFGVMNQSPDQGQAAFGTPRQLAEIGSCAISQLCKIQKGRDPSLHLVRGETEIAGINGEIFDDREIGIQIIRLRDDSDPASGKTCFGGYGMIQNRDRTRTRRRESEKQPQGRGLARTIGPEKTKALPPGNFKIQSIDCNSVRVALDETGQLDGETGLIGGFERYQRGGPLRKRDLRLRLGTAWWERVTP